MRRANSSNLPAQWETLRHPRIGSPTKGFTLVELLAVIACIGVLLALLVPVLNSMRERSMAAACVGNMRSIGVAIFAYIADNDGYFPYATNSYWDEVLTGGNYTDYNLTRRGCPANRSKLHATYGYNYNHLGTNKGNNDYPPRKLLSLTKPSETIVLSDMHRLAANLKTTPSSTNPPGWAGLVYWDDRAWLGEWAPPGHGEGVNILWADGHVGWMTRKEVVTNPTGQNRFKWGKNYYYYFLRNKETGDPYL